MLAGWGQDEEEVPPESGSDGKGENGKDEAPEEDAAKEKQDETDNSEGEEKSQEKTEDASTKTDAKVGRGSLEKSDPQQVHKV